MSGPDLYEAAVGYAAAGISVLPLHYPVPHNGALRCSCGVPDCNNAGKHPYAARVKNGLRDATTDPKVVEDWWGSGVRYNIGLCTGAASNLIAIDVDPRHGGLEALLELEERHGPLPSTRSHLTGSLGQHILFRHPGRPIRNSAGRLGPGLDIRGDAGYIVGPPSQHISGRYYTVLDDAEPAEMPAWLLTLIGDAERPRPPAVASESWRAIINEGVAEGRRNAAVASLAGVLMRPGAKSPGVVLDLLRCWNELRCKPPLSEVELVRTVQSICSRELARQLEAANVG